MFSDRGLLTMLHGIALSGGALLGLAAALFHLYAAGGKAAGAGERPAGAPLAQLTGLTALVMWAAVLVGTYVVFPPYRATPPEGVHDLASYPRATILADPQYAWLHSFGMEIKEHVPWIAVMLVTAVAFVSLRYRDRLISDPRLRRGGLAFLAISLTLGSAAGLLGILINKFAPLE